MPKNRTVMPAMTAWGPMVQALLAAVNVGWGADGDHPWNLAAAVFVAMCWGQTLLICNRIEAARG